MKFYKEFILYLQNKMEKINDYFSTFPNEPRIENAAETSLMQVKGTKIANKNSDGDHSLPLTHHGLLKLLHVLKKQGSGESAFKKFIIYADNIWGAK